MFDAFLNGVGCGMIGVALAYLGHKGLSAGQVAILLIGGILLVVTRRPYVRDH